MKDGSGRLVGRIIQNNVFGKITFNLQGASENELGAIKAENWRAWDFAIVDANDTEIGRIDKKFVGNSEGALHHRRQLRCRHQA